MVGNMTIRQKLWYGFKILLIIFAYGVLVYGAIRDKQWVASLLAGVLWTVVVVLFGGIFIGVAKNERDRL
jgi:hypothetical protein